MSLWGGRWLPTVAGEGLTGRRRLGRTITCSRAIGDGRTRWAGRLWGWLPAEVAIDLAENGSLREAISLRHAESDLGHEGLMRVGAEIGHDREDLDFRLDARSA